MTDFHDHIDQTLRALILKKIGQIVGRAGITGSDRDDLEQQIYIKILKHFQALSGEACPRGALAETVVERYLANVLRHRRAQKRHPKFVCSLSIVVDLDEDRRPIDLAATLSERDHGARFAVSRRSAQEEWELKHDIDAVTAKMPPEDNDLCERLKCDSISQVARDLGIPRSTLQGKINRLLKPFEDGRLQDFI